MVDKLVSPLKNLKDHLNHTFFRTNRKHYIYPSTGTPVPTQWDSIPDLSEKILHLTWNKLTSVVTRDHYTLSSFLCSKLFIVVIVICETG